MNDTTSPRILYLDYLRAALILLIVVEHASLAYTSTPWFNFFDCKSSGWFLIDSNAQNDGLLYIKSFRLSFAISLLFFISGLFFHRSITKHGALSYAKSRLVRIGLPLLFIALVLDPWMRYLSCQFTWVEMTPESFIRSYFTGQLSVDHGWFLWTLLVFEFAAILWWSYARDLYERFGSWLERFSLRGSSLLVIVVIASYLAYILGTLTFHKRFLLFWEIFSGPFSFIAPNMFISLMFFFLGVGIGHSMKTAKFGDIERALLGFPWLWLAISIFIFVIQAALNFGGEPLLLTMRYNPALHVNLITTPLLCVTLSLAVLSLFRTYINFPSAFMQYISRASYTIYVIHLPVCLWVSYLLIPYNIALFIKLLVSVVAGLVVSIVVYEFLKLAYAAIKFLHPTYSDK